MLVQILLVIAIGVLAFACYCSQQMLFNRNLLSEMALLPVVTVIFSSVVLIITLGDAVLARDQFFYVVFLLMTVGVGSLSIKSENTDHDDIKTLSSNIAVLLAVIAIIFVLPGYVQYNKSTSLYGWLSLALSVYFAFSNIKLHKNKDDWFNYIKNKKPLIAILASLPLFFILIKYIIASHVDDFYNQLIPDSYMLILITLIAFTPLIAFSLTGKNKNVSRTLTLSKSINYLICLFLPMTFLTGWVVDAEFNILFTNTQTMMLVISFLLISQLGINMERNKQISCLLFGLYPFSILLVL